MGNLSLHVHDLTWSMLVACLEGIRTETEVYSTILLLSIKTWVTVDVASQEFDWGLDADVGVRLVKTIHWVNMVWHCTVHINNLKDLN